MANKFKNTSGVYFTRDLFYETALGDKKNVLYTLKNEEHQGYPSLYQIYMECDDPTEYKFSQKAFDGWDHWETVSKSTFFAPYIEKWRRELEVRARSKALASIIEKASGTSREAFQAAKYVAEGYGEKAQKRGRPSKQEIARNAQDIVSHSKRIEEDFQRLMN